MSNLYELSQEMAALDEALAQAENPDAPEVKALIERAMDLTTERKIKIEGCCRLIRELESRAEARRAEAKRLNERAQIAENAAERVKAFLMNAMHVMGIKKEDTEHFTVTVANNGGKLPMTIDDDKVPDAYTTLETVVKVDKERIRKELEDGQQLAFARLGERGHTLRIK